MSLAAIGIVLNHSSAVGTAKLVLMGIAWHTGKDRLEGCYPSQQTLADYANCSTRQVRRCLSELVELEELHIVTNGSHRYGSNASTNLYTMILDCPEWCDKSNNHNFVLDYEEDTQGTSSGHLRQVNRTSEAGQADIRVL
jgi:hypothetical protein